MRIRQLAANRLSIALLLLLIVLAGILGTYYVQSRETVSQKDRQIASLEQTLNLQQTAAADLLLRESQLNATILALNSEIIGLEENASASEAQIKSLQSRVYTLENESALYSVEFGVLYAAEHVTILPLEVNDTVSLPYNGIRVFGSSSGAPGEVLAFSSNSGCPVSGIRVVQTQPQVIAIQLDTSSPLVKSYYNSTNALPYTIEFENVGHSAVQCTYSLFLVVT